MRILAAAVLALAAPLAAAQDYPAREIRSICNFAPGSGADILVRFYTVPSAKAARTSVVWAMILIGSFYIMTTFLGFGAATLVGKANIGKYVKGEEAARFIEENPDRAEALTRQLDEMGYIVTASNDNLAAPLLAERLGGDLMLSFVSAIAASI